LKNKEGRLAPHATIYDEHGQIKVAEWLNPVGIIGVAGAVREASARTLKALKAVGVSQTVMLTGDNEGTARNIAAQTGVDRHFSKFSRKTKWRLLNGCRQKEKRSQWSVTASTTLLRWQPLM
jgi:Cd2+/Zn2+-exporting ATPase